MANVAAWSTAISWATAWITMTSIAFYWTAFWSTDAIVAVAYWASSRTAN